MLSERRRATCESRSLSLKAPRFAAAVQGERSSDRFEQRSWNQMKRKSRTLRLFCACGRGGADLLLDCDRGQLR